MALTREQAIERLEARRRADYCEGGQWFDIGTAAPGKPIIVVSSLSDDELAPVLPSCKICPVLDLALTGGMSPRAALKAMHTVDYSLTDTIRRLQPHTGLTLEECREIIDFHDDPESFDREEDKDDYLVPIRVANAESLGDDWPNIV